MTESLAQSQPTIALWAILNEFFDDLKMTYPDDNTVQSSSLILVDDKDDPHCMLIDSDLFFNAYIRLPIYRALSDDDPLLSSYLNLLTYNAYTCWSQVIVEVTDRLTLDDLPSPDEFEELVWFLAPLDHLSNMVAALDWALHSDVHFGVDSDGEQPGLLHMNVLEATRDRLDLQVTDEPSNGRLNNLKKLLSREVRLLTSVVRASEFIFSHADEPGPFHVEEAILAEGVNSSVIPITKVIAAEHLSYIRNRQARSASEPETAITHYGEACRMAHLAFNASGSGRYAKYVAQNLLEIARLTDDPIRLRFAEMAWVDAYVMSYVQGLLDGGNEPFTQIGWTEPTFALGRNYPNIPPYSVEPDFIYSGAGAGLLKGIIPSFTPDFWAAAVLLTQHFKDVEHPADRLQPDLALPLFVPAEDQSARFPLRDQHPVAWVFHLAENMLTEHQTRRRPHAGLYTQRRVDLSYRIWFGGEMQAAFRGATPDSAMKASTRSFPNVVKRVILLQTTGTDEQVAQAPIWSIVANLWSS